MCSCVFHSDLLNASLCPGYKRELVLRAPGTPVQVPGLKPEVPPVMAMRTPFKSFNTSFIANALLSKEHPLLSRRLPPRLDFVK